MAANNRQEIDFVIPWVDGSDLDWRREFAKTKHDAHEDTSEIRYRDWRILHYWFRSIERYAPWVRRIHLVTWGHLPEWLNTSHPRLNVVNHADFIPSSYLPTFNSNTIELNFNRIEGLAEQFVLFNDDVFLCRPCQPEDFFRDGVPCDMARLSVVQPSSVGHIVYNNLELINNAHRKNDAIRRNLSKWFNAQYGVSNLLKSISLMPWSFFPGFFDHHMPQPYLRRQYDRAWATWGTQLDTSCRHHFRELTDLSHWLIRYDLLCRGEFSPRSLADAKLMTIDEESIEQICNDITSQRYRVICMNDSLDIRDFERLSKQLALAFDATLPDKSAYER